MEKKTKYCQYIVTGTLVAAIVLCVIVIAQVMSVGYVTVFGRSLFRVATGSMEPTIETGALLICKNEEIEDVRVADIICFRSKESNMLGQVITHRVVSIKRDAEGKKYLETAGDANPSVDGFYVTESNLIGKVSYYTKDGNWIAAIFSFMTSKMGFLCCIVFPVLFISNIIMRDSIRTIRQELNKIHTYTDSSEEELFTSEEYEAMVDRLKREILEEVKHSEEQSKVECES